MRWLSGLTVALLPLPGVAGTSIDLGALDVDASRIPSWYPPTVAERRYREAAAWPEYDATCAKAPCRSGKQGFRDAPGDPMASCSAAHPADDGGEDWSQLNCLLSSAPSSSVVYVPAGTYDMGNAQQEVLKIGRSHVVLRCESSTTTHLRLASVTSKGQAVLGSTSCSDSDYPSNMNCRASILSVGSDYEGDAVAWTSGFEEEEALVTVSDASGFGVGDWILLEIRNAGSDCTEVFLPEPPKDPRNADHALGHIAKVTAIHGNRIGIDRGLRMDYTLDPHCTSTASARPYRHVSGVGVEGCHMVSSPTVAQDDIGNVPFAQFGAGTVESWFVGNELERGEASMFAFRTAARNWFQGNTIRNYGRIDASFNTSGVSNARGAVDNVVENNVWEDFVVGVYNIQGTEGAVVAYNYLRHGSPPNTPERAILNHGLYSREILLEGNDTDGRIVTADHWWGPNGPRITAFRNRVVGSGAGSMIGINRDKAGDWIIADRVNWLGNIARYFLSSPECVNGFADCLRGPHDFDGAGTPSSAAATNMHVEKNVFRDASTCAGDPTSKRCGFHQDSPRSETSCGTSRGPGDCGGGTGDNAGGDSAPPSWRTDRIPHSLYRPSRRAPSWWCQEACSWSDVHAGIGAWGDDFSGPLCKLPAQIRAEGGTCTAVPTPGGG